MALRSTIAVIPLLVLCSMIAVNVEAQAPASEDVRFKINGVSIAGTLLVPASPAPAPVVLIIAGSGPTDRDGNSAALPGKNNSLKMLAEALAAEGIASLRYDKRAIAGSRDASIREADLRFDHFVDDAAALVGELKRDKRFSSVTVAGHSEGSLVGMIAAAKAAASAYVSLEGPGRRASIGLTDQLRTQLGAMPGMMDAITSVVASLDRGETVETLPAVVSALPPVAQLFRASVQPYLISWFKYDPAVEIAKLTIPVVIVQGTTDLQVPTSDAAALAKGAPKATVRTITGMNHILKMVDGDLAKQVPTYMDPTLPLAPEVPRAIAELIRGLR